MTADSDRRSGRDRRRSGGGRRTTDTEGRFAALPALWAIVGALVVAYLFFMALGNVRPGDAPVATVVALVLAVAWLAHAWRRLLLGSRSPVGDRERRGF
jgi:peptidoglycan/LPS O-acetylase OafA/YrhL